MWAMIATWRMALEGLEEACRSLAAGGSAGDAIETAICQVEDFPYYKSVGYGGLPNEAMEVELDAAYMDGKTLDFGAVCAVKDIANPIRVARSLSRLKVNNILVAAGAEAYAGAEGFERKNMLSDRAKIHYRRRKAELAGETELRPYAGHDTVAMVALDTDGGMVAGTSTSGLFMKKRGRVGDSPFIGSGLYVDAQVGGAGATGLGEDLLKGVISYEITRKMEAGLSPQMACEEAVRELEQRLLQRRGVAGDLSVVALNAQGEWGCATNIENFSFVVCTEKQSATVYRCFRENGHTVHRPADEAWLTAYMTERMRPLEEESC